MKKGDNLFLGIFSLLSLSLIAIVFLSSSQVQFSSPSDCFEDAGAYTYSASSNQVMTVTLKSSGQSYQEKHILCYEGNWIEAKPADSNWAWFIDNSVSSCTQVGSWYLNKTDEDVGDNFGIWKNDANAYASCPIPLTPEEVDFDCDGVISQADGQDINDIFLRDLSTPKTLNQAYVNDVHVDYSCDNLGDYFQELLNYGRTIFSFDELDSVNSKLILWDGQTVSSMGLIFSASFDSQSLNDSIGGNVGTSFGGINYANGQDGGKAVSFDGDNDYLKFSNLNLANKDFSFSFWVRPNFDYNDNFVEDNNPTFLAWKGEDDSQLRVYQHEDALTAFLMNSNDEDDWSYDDYEFSEDDWIFIVGTYDDSDNEIQLYINGEEARSGDGDGGNGLSGNGELFIGAGANGNNNYDGLIDDLKFYNYVLDQEEILDMCEDCEINVDGLVIYTTDSEWNGNFSDSRHSVDFSVSGSSGLARADYICQNDENKPDTQDSFKALIGTDAREVGASDWILEDEISYYTSNGLLIAETNEDGWFDFDLDHAISSENDDVFTGLKTSGKSEADNCEDWSIGDDDEQATIGISNSKTSSSIKGSSNLDCDRYAKIYCVQIDGDNSGSCSPNWQVGNWSQTVEGTECGTRTVTDLNNCGALTGKPEGSRICTSASRCGDGACDFGESCSTDCSTDSVCGDENVDFSSGEECDDGNSLSGDGCSSSCKNETPLSNAWVYGIIAFLVVALILVSYLIYNNMKKKRSKSGLDYNPKNLSKPVPSPPRNR